MKQLELRPKPFKFKIGDECPFFEPNITEDTLFVSDGNPIGFYLKKMPEKMCKLADLANSELRSKNVPKSAMDRKKPMGQDVNGKKKYFILTQYSTILGSCPPKPHMRRPYASISSVHQHKSAQTFIKAMLLLAKESEQLIADILPDQYARQVELFKRVPDKWKFGNLFTSSISNYNISAPFHQDNGNIVGAVNVIICKKLNARGGDLHIPAYDATIGQEDNSVLIYPAWKDIHGVTPIKPTHDAGYRNSLVFYPLKAFMNL